MTLLPYIEQIAAGQELSEADSFAAMHVVLAGNASAPQIAAFLMGMRMKGPTVDELVGFARSMREMAAPVAVGLPGVPLLDTCGTGGDGAGTFNISTLVAFVTAGAGVHVAKHGNRSASSDCGSADLFEALGVNLAISPADAARAIREIGIGFLFAQSIHTAMKHAHPVRADLKMRTVFNLLGPLTNPVANVQVVGAPSPETAKLLAGALARLGMVRGYVVHGYDGLDEVSTTAPTLVYEIQEGQVKQRTLDPGDFALRKAVPADLKGGSKARNLEIARAVLAGERGPHRDIVIANSAVALAAVAQVETFLEGAAVAAVSIDSGAARDKLEALARFTHVCG
ncbi:MAG: anthranilate phosphoribosyltransferase [Bryobacteraceae bacterium]|jgi:anthranilate phosphoribosyltransferase